MFAGGATNGNVLGGPATTNAFLPNGNLGGGRVGPLIHNMSNSIGRNIHVLMPDDAEGEKQFCYDAVMRFYADCANRNHPLFQVMKVVSVKESGLFVRVRTEEAPVTALEGRPIGTGGLGSFTRAHTSMMRLKRMGEGMEAILDTLGTHDGRVDFMQRLKRQLDAVDNSMMNFALEALTADPDDNFSRMRLQCRQEDKVTVSTLGNRLSRDLVGCLNNKTGAIKQVVSVFNRLFNFYSSGVKYLIVTPETLAVLDTRPFIPEGLPAVRLASETSPSGKETIGHGTHLVLADDGSTKIIVAPLLPQGVTSRMKQHLEHNVYASGYHLLDTGSLDEVNTRKPDGVRIFDSMRTEFVTISVQSAIDADFFLNTPCPIKIDLHGTGLAGHELDGGAWESDEPIMSFSKLLKVASRAIVGDEDGANQEKFLEEFRSTVNNIVSASVSKHGQGGLDFTFSPCGFSPAAFLEFKNSHVGRLYAKFKPPSTSLIGSFLISVNELSGAVNTGIDNKFLKPRVQEVLLLLAKLKAPHVFCMHPKVQTAFLNHQRGSSRAGEFAAATEDIIDHMQSAAGGSASGSGLGSTSGSGLGLGLDISTVLPKYAIIPGVSTATAFRDGTGAVVQGGPHDAPLNVFGGEYSLRNWCESHCTAPWPYLLVRPYYHAKAHMMLVTSGEVGIVCVKGQMEKSADDAIASTRIYQLHVYMNAMVVRRHCLACLFNAHILPGITGGGVQLLYPKSGNAFDLKDVKELQQIDSSKRNKVHMVALPILGGVDGFERVEWAMNTEHLTLSLGRLDLKKAAQHTLANFMNFLKLKPALDNAEQPGGYSPSERVRFCTTAYVDPDLGPSADPTYTLAPESTTSMHGSTALAQRKGCHPYGVVLDHCDIYGTAGLPGSSGHEVRHGDYRVHGIA